jgi:hypothetical protein
MGERLPEPRQQRLHYEPVSPAGDVAKKNVRLGLALFGIALLFAVGAVVVSLIYLQFD